LRIGLNDAIRSLDSPGFVAYVALWAAFIRTTWRVYTWALNITYAPGLVPGRRPGTKSDQERPEDGPSSRVAHQIFGLTDAFMLGTKPGIVM